MIVINLKEIALFILKVMVTVMIVTLPLWFVSNEVAENTGNDTANKIADLTVLAFICALGVIVALGIISLVYALWYMA
jgi:flagellar biosynthesis protein FlhB